MYASTKRNAIAEGNKQLACVTHYIHILHSPRLGIQRQQGYNQSLTSGQFPSPELICIKISVHSLHTYKYLLVKPKELLASITVPWCPRSTSSRPTPCKPGTSDPPAWPASTYPRIPYTHTNAYTARSTYHSDHTNTRRIP